MHEPSPPPAPAMLTSTPVQGLPARRSRIHQGLIDAEMRATRRAILAQFRLRLRTDASTLSSADFLTLADELTVHMAIMITVRGIVGPDACLLHTCDPGTTPLRLVRHRSLPDHDAHRVAAIGSAVAAALPPGTDTADPVLIGDLAGTATGVGQTTAQV